MLDLKTHWIGQTQPPGASAPFCNGGRTARDTDLASVLYTRVQCPKPSSSYQQ